MNPKTTLPAVFSSVAILGMALVIATMLFPVDSVFSREINQSSPYIMVGFFTLGLAALVCRQERLMKSSFLAVAVLAFILRSSAVSSFEEPSAQALAFKDTEQLQPVSVSQYSTSNLIVEGAPSIETILNSNADLVTIQGLTPDWSNLLVDSLTHAYPHYYLFEDIGVHGLGLFSRIELGSVDSFLIGDVVQVSACLSGKGTLPELTLVAVQTTPPVNSGSYQEMKAQLAALSDYVADISGPSITIGDFNNMPWSNELSAFQINADLKDSRRSLFPTYHEGAPHLFDRPVEHIFYSKDLQCLQYRAQRDGSTYIGSGATFQLKSDRSAMVAR
jgi:endonuclease/exonuclease/phosphatase (EEP) superfamily protein YafD